MGRERGLVPVWDGLIKVAAATPDIRVADCGYNAGQIVELCTQAAEQGVKVICFPELCVTGYTCGDLFLQDTLLRGAEAALEGILDYGRPNRVELLVLVDRGHRELPIHAVYVGRSVNTSRAEQVNVLLEERDGVDEVRLTALP